MNKQEPNPAWFIAAENNDVPKLRRYMVSSQKKLDSSGRTALMYAASSASEDAIKFLVEDEGQIRGPGGWTALMEASASGQLRSIELLSPLLAGSRMLDGHPYFKKGTTALTISAEKGDFAAVQLLQNEQDAAGWTELHWAAFNQRYAEIYAQTAYFSRPDLLKRSPIFYAVFSVPQHDKLISLPHQLAIQTSPLILDDKTYAALIHILCKQPDALQFKLDSYGKSPLHYAVESNNLVAAKVLSKYFSGVKTTRLCKDYAAGTTALMIAVLNLNIEMVKILVKYEHGLKNELGLPAIYLANQIPQQNTRIIILQLLYQKEKKVLIKERENGKLRVSTMEQSLNGNLLNSLEQSTRVEQDFNEIIEGLTEDNKEEVCEYLCEKLAFVVQNKEINDIKDAEDLGFAELYIKEMDDQHVIIRSILDIILSKNTQIGIENTQLLLQDFDLLSNGQKLTEQSLSEYVQVLQSENKTLKQNLENIQSSILQKSETLNVDGVLEKELKETVKNLQEELTTYKEQLKKLEEENRKYKQKLEQTNHLLSQSLVDSQVSQQQQEYSLSSPHKNPFKHNQSQVQCNGLVVNNDSSHSADVFLSLNSTSIQNSQMVDLNRKLSDLELLNRQYKEDLQINCIMYEEKLQKQTISISNYEDEQKQLQQTIDQLLDEINQLQTDDNYNKETISDLEEQIYACNVDINQLSETSRKFEKDNSQFILDKQYLAEYITDLTQNLMITQQKLDDQIQQIKQNQQDTSSLSSQINEQQSLLKQQSNQNLYIQQLEQQISELNRERVKLINKIKLHQHQIKEADTTISQLSASIVTIVDNINLEFNQQISRSLNLPVQLESAVNFLTEQLRTLCKKTQNFDQGIDNFIDQLSQQSNSLLQTVNQVSNK
ncbi:Ankyrin repeat-containing protein [Spironucleus salmonicida]|uniref:Ankyrin repeat-containing protein n=1 Tax=Spironucleus salmonicida TaxID=348837 RepID=V6LQN0_9EUKA|nr:Ankyrin repeat-containing protein [Spironucleus salmonicida]|eukprot:EST46011.1 Ankyrin repeat-containing protein [Spironucleus salmonicida]